VYVTNKASGLTTEPSTAVSGRTSATTVYGTYASFASTGTTARDIVANSDRFIVTVVDNDMNTTTAISSQRSGVAGYNTAIGNANDVLDIQGSGFNSVGEKVMLTLTADLANPIIGSASDIKVRAHNGANIPNVSVVINFAGDGTNPPLITLSYNYGSGAIGIVDIGYPSSAKDSLTVAVKSVVDAGGTARVSLTETGRNTGRFEGEVLVRELIPSSTYAFTVGLPGIGTFGDPGEIPAVAGPITVSYVDAATSGTAINTTRTATYAIDTTGPTATISTPTTASETQNRLPTFTGSVTDNGSGLDVSAFSLNIDDDPDKLNANPIIASGGTRATAAYPGTALVPAVIGKVASISVTGKADGINTLPFTYTETVVLPLTTPNPDHLVDFQVRAADLAGNYGYSDADSSKGNLESSGRHGNQPHTIKIDQIIPNILTSETGISWDTSITTPAEKANVRDSIVVRFDGKVKESSVSASDFQVVLSGAGGTFVPASVVVQGKNVYLDLDSTIPSNNKPTVKIQGTVQDLAGNSTDSGSAVAADKLAPVITVVRSAGSGIGTGTEAADSLTADKMTVTITSDEDLQAAPTVTVTDLNANLTAVSTAGNVNNATQAVAQGGNVWSLVVSKGTSAAGIRGVSVAASDTASNAQTSGDITSPYTKSYTLDLVVSTPTSTPANAGTTTQSNPFLTTDYSAGSEASSVTITSATLDTVDVTSSVIASADSKTFFFQPATALTNASHTYVVNAKDAAGNTLKTTTKFTKSDRTDFVVELFAGWNSVSFPSNPLDTDVNTVLSNSGVKQVVAYDATTPSQPWRIASKVDTADYTSQTTPGLSSITAGPGYWVETSNFEDQKVSLEGPTGPGDARPGLTTIATGNGWNLVGVVDQSRSQTQSGNKGATLTRPNAAGTDGNVLAGAYFNTVNNGRAYTFDTVTSKFREQIGTDTVTIGSGIWVFISPQTNGQLPHIVP
jgi:hypothetical protein